MQRVLTQVVATLAVLTTMGAAHGPNTMEKSSAAASTKTVQTASAAPKLTALKKAKPYEVGPASWYGKFFHGKQTASGETYNMYEMTAAHPDLPLGTRVLVTDMKNGKSVVVRVNDRGPLVPGRIIDLSYGAAQALGFTAKGVQKVRLDIVPPDRQIQTAALR
ncbi:MAG TPA: septal ring lytic transglycosylase RlpA family protein [Candidatus Koribacter sp.]|jgi:rare lipoprotein A